MGANELFESAAVWDQELQIGQRNLIQAITDHWPAEITSVLDVGCGDGKITQALAERTGAVFHGLDASYEALARIRHLRTTVGSAAELPFPDRAFDAALSTDVFEHLPEDVEAAAWSELFRVARNWVFLAVPFREELLDATTRCPSCGAQYHVNWHLRAYDFKDLASRAPQGWHLSSLILSGEAWSPMLPPETVWRRQILDEWSGWTEALCPQCGAHGFHAPRPNALPAEAAIELGQKIYKSVRQQHFLRSHSEILAIYNRTGDPPAQMGDLPVRSTLEPAASWNVAHGLSPNLDPYPQYGKMVAAVDGGFIVQLPVYPDAPHRMRFTLKENAGSVSIAIEDGRGLLLRTVVGDGGRISFDVDLPRDPVPGYYGLIIRISGAKQPLQSVLFGRAPEVSRLSPAEGNTGYFRVPGSKLSIQVNEPLSFDQRAIASFCTVRDGDVGSASSSKSVLMLCHDQHLDRRVIAQARSLSSRGVDVTLLALAFDAEGSEEITPEGVRVVRIGLSEIVPENQIYNTYMRVQRGLNGFYDRAISTHHRLGRMVRKGHVALLRGNWLSYRTALWVAYRNWHLHDPLCYRSAFVKHASVLDGDVIQVHDLPALEAGAEIARQRGAPLVYDAHELYSEQKAFSGVQRRICSAAEERLIKRADVVFTVNQSIADVMARRYGIEEPVVLLNATEPPTEFDHNARYDLLREKCAIPSAQRILLYQGGFAPNRNLEQLVASFSLVKTEDAVLVLMGFGAFEDRLRKVATKHNLIGRRVYFLPAVPQEQLLQHSASADLGIIPYPHVDLNSLYCTPNKLFEFIQAGLPMLTNQSPELERFVAREGFGLSRPMRDAREIARAIDEAFASGDFPSWRENLKERRSDYSWQAQSANYLAKVMPLVFDAPSGARNDPTLKNSDRAELI